MHICFLDIDGTLVSTAGAGQAAFAVTLAKDFGITDVTTSGVAFAGRSDRAIALDMFAALRDRANAGSLVAVSRRLHQAAGRGAARVQRPGAARGRAALGEVDCSRRRGPRPPHRECPRSGAAEAAALQALGLVPVRRLWRRAHRPLRHRGRGSRGGEGAFERQRLDRRTARSSSSATRSTTFAVPGRSVRGAWPYRRGRLQSTCSAAAVPMRLSIRWKTRRP